MCRGLKLWMLNDVESQSVTKVALESGPWRPFLCFFPAVLERERERKNFRWRQAQKRSSHHREASAKPDRVARLCSAWHRTWKWNKSLL